RSKIAGGTAAPKGLIDASVLASRLRSRRFKWRSLIRQGCDHSIRPPRPERARSIGMKKLVLETTAPFQGLPELVAYDEGLFAQEGLAVEWADREQGVEKKVERNVTNPKDVDPFTSHGKLFEQGKADMYNACEWGNYCRVQSTATGSRQIGRRAIV